MRGAGLVREPWRRFLGRLQPGSERMRSPLFDLLGPRCLVGYLGDKDWSLSFIWKDLIATRAMEGVRCVQALDPEQLKDAFQGADAYVLVLSHGHLKTVLQAGVPPERVLLYFDHVRLGKRLRGLKGLGAVLAQNWFELELLAIAGAQPETLHHFPVGVDRRLFYPPEVKGDTAAPSRSLDVVFLGQYVPARIASYHRRKRIAFEADLASALVEAGLRVAILGPGWEGAEHPLHPDVQCLDLPHADFGALLRSARLVCSVSAQEGGPLSFLEGLACGCLMVSTMTGFALDFASGWDGIWHVPLRAPREAWVERIQSVLAEEQPQVGSLSAGREQVLQEADFEGLAAKLVGLCWPRPQED
jgi:glycosyltransferase involved in cell wall biosynthesis